MATKNGCDVNQLEYDSLLPPRKRLLAGFKKQNSNGSPSPPLHCFASSSSTTSTSNGSSSASTDVQTHLDNLLTSDQTRSPEELAQASKATADLAVKVAKAARATANEKAVIASKAVAAAKSALELFASFPVSSKEKSPRKKKHVPVQLLYSKEVADEDLASRLNRAINNSTRVLKNCSGHRNKKQKSVVTSTMYDGHDVAGVVDSDSSNDDEVDKTRVNDKMVLCKEKTGEESSSLGKRRGRVKLPLSMCGSKDQEKLEKNVEVGKPVAQREGSSTGGVAQVIAGPSRKCQELKSLECVKQNKVVSS